MAVQTESAARDKSTIIQIITWIMFIGSVLGVVGGMGTKYVLTRQLSWDDGLMPLALAASLAQCIAISLAASNGLGKEQSTLSPDAVDGFLKGEYASIPFLILSIALVKWSISAFINYLSPSSRHHQAVMALRAVIVLWTVTAILTSLFQCAPPRTWDYAHGVHCVDRRAWWAYVSAVNILTELVIIVLYFTIIGNLQISRMKKANLLTIFSTRGLVVAATVAQLAVFWSAVPSPATDDLTDNLWLPILLNQIVVCVSVVTACLPYLKPLMDSLESGLVRANLPGGSEEEFSQELSHRSGGSTNISAYGHQRSY
ncbi:hypothetical protein B0T22DRAFT_137696 [Podospora appendiculata]|uniref:Rhodopsin domain-containing protein n=1 Tax=Podospora appendiculata TaxID=314037 RepID=A0AAE0X813_9PEZI|nr:hypothetical protein B0T22DRAFT_137696 [Podospora appendiculata]